MSCLKAIKADLKLLALEHCEKEDRSTGDSIQTLGGLEGRSDRRVAGNNDRRVTGNGI